MHTNHYGDNMTKNTRPTYSPEYKVECTQLVLDQGYSIREAAEAMSVGKSTSALLMSDSMNGLR